MPKQPAPALQGHESVQWSCRWVLLAAVQRCSKPAVHLPCRVVQDRSSVQPCVCCTTLCPRPSLRQQRKGQAHLYSQGQSIRKPRGYPDCLYFKPSCVLCSPCDTKVSKGLACAACFLPLISELKSLNQQDWLPCTPVPSLQSSGETVLQPCACCQATQACPLQLHPGIARVAKATGTAGVQC